MIWLIGAGGMSVDYVKVLKAQNEDFIVIGRGRDSAERFEKLAEQTVIQGGVDSFLKTTPELPKAVIISVGVEELYNSAMLVLDYGVKNILIEKPGGISTYEIKNLKERSDNAHANIYIAYNRRFFSSVLKALEMINLDGGVTSFNFELTEWSHVIGTLDKKPEVLATWFLGNTTHVVDLAFFLGGKPDNMSCFTSGGLDWHPNSSIFSGAGITTDGALFNYAANWESAGRWSVEMLTNKNKYILRPMESLQVQKRGTIGSITVDIDDRLDKDFKPGLYRQVSAFLDGDNTHLCSINEQFKLFPFYKKMANY